ncbi:hypothetical protein [Actinomycetospora termitidis]|uniref:Uncharacterized protein n=1 Tax=Actinomycetospora termitidis TaxID=3053470 RepID=A0ABT7M4W2_9PSEU|nr:hypothetical protein [Actinomycetospora sp. Odt1-22]MDL5155723.1 hypothetical protein [Actinomycetospora sp. Odt1-22]
MIVGITAVVVITLVVIAVVLRAGPTSAPVAPRLSPGYAPTLLARAGFPATAHNVAVLHDHLGAAFLDAARDALPGEAFTALRARCAGARGGVPVVGGSSRSWPQRVLDETAAGGADVTALPRYAQDALLATAGTGHGLFGGSVFAPLPALPTDLFPTTGAVPSPRPATTPVVTPA